MLKLLWTLSVDRIGGSSVYHSFDAPDFRYPATGVSSAK